MRLPLLRHLARVALDAAGGSRGAPSRGDRAGRGRGAGRRLPCRRVRPRRRPAGGAGVHLRHGAGQLPAGGGGSRPGPDPGAGVERRPAPRAAGRRRQSDDCAARHLRQLHPLERRAAGAGAAHRSAGDIDHRRSGGVPRRLRAGRTGASQLSVPRAAGTGTGAGAAGGRRRRSALASGHGTVHHLPGDSLGRGAPGGGGVWAPQPDRGEPPRVAGGGRPAARLRRRRGRAGRAPRLAAARRRYQRRTRHTGAAAPVAEPLRARAAAPGLRAPIRLPRGSQAVFGAGHRRGAAPGAGGGQSGAPRSQPFGSAAGRGRPAPRRAPAPPEMSAAARLRLRGFGEGRGRAGAGGAGRMERRPPQPR